MKNRIVSISLVVALALSVGLVGYGSGEVLATTEYNLTISSTAGGNVTTPGEGTYTYDAGIVVNLVAEPEEGHRFVNWTGHVGTIADVNAASTNITVSGNYSMTANFVAVEAGHVGIKAGDWMKVTYNITGLPAEQRYAEWLKLEFLTVEGTNATVRATLGISDGTEQTATGSLDVVSSGGVPELPGIIVSANLTMGDSVPMAGYGNVTIEGEATRTYVGADRRVVYTSFSVNETDVTYFWDKLTGVMVEKSLTSSNITATGRATETNMWGGEAATVVGMPRWPWRIVTGVAVGLVTFFVLRRRAARAKVG